MFQTLDTMISLGVIFLILSMVNKYLISLVKRVFKIKAKVITKELETFIGENTSKYLIPYLEKKTKHLNFTDGKKRLRQLNKEQLRMVVDELERFIEDNNNNVGLIQRELGINAKDIKVGIEEIKEHLGTLKGRIENMYDNTMEKISEVYETKIRYRALYFGLALAFVVNADFFYIYSSLSKNSIIREELVARSDVINAQVELVSKQIELSEKKSISEIKPEFDEAKKNITDLTTTITDAGLELGWTSDKFSKIFKNKAHKSSKEVWAAAVYKFIGLLIAGLLISFGAPFWHDFIGTFTGLRKTLRGKKEGSGENNTSPPANPLIK